MKYVVIVNGRPLSGKDTFINKCCAYIKGNTMHISSIDPVKDVLRELGWDGTKSDNIRNLLSQLKSFWIANNDGPTGYLIRNILEYGKDSRDDYVIFTQIREPDEIAKFRSAMVALKSLDIRVVTLLVTRHDTHIKCSNTSDANVNDYGYDVYIDNNGTENDLNSTAIQFIGKLLKGENRI
jgi:hypothetical protein